LSEDKEGVCLTTLINSGRGKGRDAEKFHFFIRRQIIEIQAGSAEEEFLE
jgi:hypothetical protein